MKERSDLIMYRLKQAEETLETAKFLMKIEQFVLRAKKHLETK